MTDATKRRETASDDTSGKSRRNFLRRAVVATGATGAAAAAYATGTTVESTPDSAKPAPKSDKGYRETDHIREYYRLARF